MRDFGDDELEYYLESGEWRGKAGGYAVQGLGSFLVEAIVGCYYNVVGLPLSDIIPILARMGEWPPNRGRPSGRPGP